MAFGLVLLLTLIIAFVGVSSGGGGGSPAQTPANGEYKQSDDIVNRGDKDGGINTRINGHNQELPPPDIAGLKKENHDRPFHAFRALNLVD